ncbi:DNA-directed RNA polymerase I subunit rpa49 [Microsporum audouinii]
MGSSLVEKKRKRASDRPERPSKKPAIDSNAAPAKVRFMNNEAGHVPIIASSPGLTVPETLPLNTYMRRRQQRIKHIENTNLSSTELLLHTSGHPKLNFTGREGENELDNLLNHYVAVYDPKENTVQLLEARKMMVRGCPRAAIVDVEEDTDEESAPTALSQRAALAAAFGTKLARKAVAAITENALTSNASASSTKAAESALLSSMPQDAMTIAAAEKSAQEEIQASKPLPQPNLSATQPADVYSIESLVPNGLPTLRKIPVQDWQAAVAASEGITTTSRFVANRVEAAVQSGNKTIVQLLRFILILIEFSRSLKRSSGGGRGPDSKKLPPREDLRRLLSKAVDSETSSTPTITDPFLDSIRRKFVPQGSFLSRNDITLLHTTICAMSLHIPPASGKTGGGSVSELATDPSDLRDDLRLENDTILKYFRELGCRVDKPRETEFAKWSIKGGKAEAASKRIARLKIPVEFPKVSRGRMSRK